jgi:hypothetical protein
VRPVAHENEPAGSDTFLVVASNIVGVLIVLVLLAGSRPKQRPVDVKPTANPLAQRLASSRASNLTLERAIHDLDRQIDQLKRQAKLRDTERLMLATVLRAAQQEVDQRRARLDADAQKRYDAQRSLALARSEAEQLEARRVRLASIRPAVRTIENTSTAHSKQVEGNELHVQLRGGRVAVIPLAELIERFKASARNNGHKLREHPELSETVGPVGNFYLKYVLERVDVSAEMALKTGQSGSFVRLRRWELTPVAPQVGETLAEALSNRSFLRAALDQANPRTWTVTLWTYPDSFETFRQVRKELYRLGYSVAGRPLPEGMPIAGSPAGTRSAAQ